MLRALCDESYAGSPRDTSIYVVAGFIGSPDQWDYFDKLWRESMSDLGIQAVGCHASKCAAGHKPFDGFTSPHRREIQHRLLVDIVAAQLHGCVAVCDLDGYRPRRPKFARLLAKHEQKLNEPHMFAVRQCVYLMLHITDDGHGEEVEFVFDRNTEFGGRAREWYNATVKTDEVCGPRLAAFTEDERMKVVGLQAADMLAYAAFRHHSGRQSWQYQALTNARPGVGEMVFDEAYWDYTERRLDESSY